MRVRNIASALLATLLGAAAMLPVVALAQGEVNVYSSRHYDADKQLFSGFTKTTGIKVNVIEAETGPLLQRLKSEDRNSPADVLITVDMGNIWRAQEAGVLQPVKSAVLDETIPANLRDPDGTWYGISVRARVLAYAKDRVKPADLSTYEDLANPKWKGKILVRSSTHVYNQSLTASMIAANGVEKTEAWAKGLAANLARDPKGGDTDQIKAVAAGEGDIAVVNSYYYARLLASDKAEDKAIIEKVGIFFPNQNDRGTHHQHHRHRRGEVCAEQGQCREAAGIHGRQGRAGGVRGRQQRVPDPHRCRAHLGGDELRRLQDRRPQSCGPR